jgi:hypothetical protein
MTKQRAACERARADVRVGRYAEKFYFQGRSGFVVADCACVLRHAVERAAHLAFPASHFSP